MARVILLGGSSIVGWTVYRLFSNQLLAFRPPYASHPKAKAMHVLRLESEEAFASLFMDRSPEILIHCGGICDVGKCEENREFAYRLNVESIHHLLRHIPAETKLVYVSSDHVFGEDGSYTEKSDPCPISYYGECRVRAEEEIRKRHANHLILRHGLPLGPSLTGKNGHLDWLSYRLDKGLPVTIVRDEARSVVKAEALARRIWDLAHSKVGGTRHVESDSFLERPILAQILKKELGLPGRLQFEPRSARPYPHLGKVELKTVYEGDLARPLSAW